MPFQRFVIKTNALQTQYIIFYQDGTCCVYDDIISGIKIPKEYYDQMLQFVRRRWGEDYTATIVNTQMTEDEIKEMQETSNAFVANLTPKVFHNSKISLVD